ELVVVAADQAGGALEDVGALRRRAAAPVALERQAGRGHRGVDLGGARPRHLREQLARRPVEVLERGRRPRPPPPPEPAAAPARAPRGGSAARALADPPHRRPSIPIASSTSANRLSKESATSAPASASAGALSFGLPRPRSITAAACPKTVPGGNSSMNPPS